MLHQSSLTTPMICEEGCCCHAEEIIYKESVGVWFAQSNKATGICSESGPPDSVMVKALDLQFEGSSGSNPSYFTFR